MWGDSKHGTWSFSIINEGVGSGLPKNFQATSGESQTWWPFAELRGPASQTLMVVHGWKKIETIFNGL